MLRFRGKLGQLAASACWLLLVSVGAHAQALGADDLRKIASTYSENEMRFKRDFAGRAFSAMLPFRSAKENLMFKGRYIVGFGKGSFTSDVDCEVSSQSDIDRISDWNQGDMITVSGRVSDVTFGSVELKPCQMSK